MSMVVTGRSNPIDLFFVCLGTVWDDHSKENNRPAQADKESRKRENDRLEPNNERRLSHSARDPVAVLNQTLRTGPSHLTISHLMI